MRKKVCELVPGDVMSGSGERIIGKSAGVRTPSGKMEVYLESEHGRRCVLWGKHTVVGVEDLDAIQDYNHRPE